MSKFDPMVESAAHSSKRKITQIISGNSENELQIESSKNHRELGQLNFSGKSLESPYVYTAPNNL